MMCNKEQMSGKLEWKINLPDGKSKVLEAEKGLAARIYEKIRRFFIESWKMGVAEPKKFIHCLKVGLALSIVSLFYYMRPLYEGVGGNAMWAIMTVVVVFEYTVGATLYKCVNRTIATTLAGSLGVGIHWIASQCGQKYEPIVLGASVFIFATAATYSRFIPSVKARFDYGAMIFILTFSLVSVSGYRVDKLLMLAHHRVSTIAIGTSLCILVSMLFWPVWAGSQLHHQTISNLEKLANSLEGCVAEYFSYEENTYITEEDLTKKLQGYKCVLNSKASEESMANLARWEPTHGHFYFGYPWKQYLKIDAAARNCAYCIDNLSSCIDSDMQAPMFLKNHIKDECVRLSLCSSEVLRELAITIKTRTRSSNIDFSVDEMNLAVQDLQNVLEYLPYQIILSSSTIKSSADGNSEKIENPNKASILDVLPLGTLMTLLIESVARIQEIVLTVDKLASMAEFETQKEEKSKENEPSENTETNGHDHQEATKTLEKV